MAKQQTDVLGAALKEIDVDAYVSEGGIKTHYPHPKEIFGPMLDRVSKLPVSKVVVETSRPVETRDEAQKSHKAYGRMKVEVFVGDEDGFGHTAVIGKVYVFDYKQPQYIVYGGRRAMVCLNLHVLSADKVVIVPGQDKDFGNGSTIQLVDSIGADAEAWHKHVTSMQAKTFSRKGLHEVLGNLLVKGTDPAAGFGPELVANAAGLLTDGKSRYSIGKDGDATVDGWNVLQAMTQGITDRAYINVAPTKTLAVVQAVSGIILN